MLGVRLAPATRKRLERQMELEGVNGTGYAGVLVYRWQGKSFVP